MLYVQSVIVSYHHRHESQSDKILRHIICSLGENEKRLPEGQPCAHEGTRTPTTLRHQILSLTRLPITPHALSECKVTLLFLNYQVLRHFSTKKICAFHNFGEVAMENKMQRCFAFANEISQNFAFHFEFLSVCTIFAE